MALRQSREELQVLQEKYTELQEELNLEQSKSKRLEYQYHRRLEELNSEIRSLQVGSGYDHFLLSHAKLVQVS